MKSRALGLRPMDMSSMNDLAGRHLILLPFYNVLPPHLRMTRLMRSFCETTHTTLLTIIMYVRGHQPHQLRVLTFYSYLPMTFNAVTRTIVPQTLQQRSPM